jgi:hypothetical protein
MAALTNEQKELLTFLSRVSITDYLRQRWEPTVGSLDRWITTFTQAGLLREATMREKFASIYGLEQYKALSKQYGLKTSGKKADLAQALCDVMPVHEIQKATAHVRLYHATDSGTNIIDAYAAEKIHAHDVMEGEAFTALLGGHLQGAVDTILRHKREFGFPRLQSSETVYNIATGSTTERSTVIHAEGFDGKTLQEAAYLLRHPIADIPLDEQKRRAIAARLALSCLIGADDKKVADHLLQTTHGVFPCPALVEFLKNPCGTLVGTDVTAVTPKQLAQIYAHTRFFEASTAVELAELLAKHFSTGIQIIAAKDPHCRICNAGKHHFSWSDIQSMPKLPRHWGCRCLYASWTKDIRDIF